MRQNIHVVRSELEATVPPEAPRDTRTADSKLQGPALPELRQGAQVVDGELQVSPTPPRESSAYPMAELSAVTFVQELPTEERESVYVVSPVERT